MPVNSMRDVFAHAQAAAADQLAGQVENADRLAHVEHEDLAALPDRPACMTSWLASGIVMK